MDYILSIDAGTSVIKAAIYSLNGIDLYQSFCTTKIISPKNGFFEQDMTEIWSAFCQAVIDVLNISSINKKNIIAIGLTAQGDGCWIIDSQGNPIRNAIIWMDGRAHNIIKEWQKKDIDKIVFSINGSVIFPGSMAGILKWLSKNEPHTLSKARYALYCKDWLKYKLTGTITTDETDASLPFFNIRTRSYSKDIFKILNLQKYTKLLPEPLETLKNKSTLTKEVATKFNLNSGIPVIAGPIDVIATATGAGAINKGDACSILGTTCFNQIILESPEIVPFNIGFTLCGPDKNMWIRAMGSMAGTTNLDWILKNLDFQEKDRINNKINYELLELKLQKIPPLCDGLIYHPFILESGERSPFIKESIRAQFFGLSQKHSVYHLIRAVYEGIAFSVLDSYAHLPYKINNIRLAGGGSKSLFWCQLIADVTGTRVITTEGVEIGTKGAAITTMVSEGIFTSFHEAVKKTIKKKKEFYPNKNNTKLYKEFYKLYVNIYKNLWEDWDKRAKLLKKYFK
jgi:sugar (pentulose or hexulose) kinase